MQCESTQARRLAHHCPEEEKMSYDQVTEHTGSVSRPIVRRQRGVLRVVTDLVVEEFPVALVFNGTSHAVVMATRLDLEAFAVGFALSEGIVERAADIHDLDVFMHADSAEVQLTIARPAFLQLKGKQRALAGRTGCGVCGVESIELLDLQPPKIARRKGARRIAFGDRIRRARTAGAADSDALAQRLNT
jgi:FdhD protein